MRFSLKWILTAAVYVAVGAAGLTQRSWVYADLLWVMTALALVLAGLLAVYMHGRGRTVATGFLLAAAGYLIYSMLTPMFYTVTSRILLASGYDPGGVRFLAPAPAQQDSALNPPPSPAEIDIFGEPFSDDPFGAPSPDPYGPARAQQQPGPSVTVISFEQFARAANALGTMAFGLLGALVGLLAARIIIKDQRA